MGELATVNEFISQSRRVTGEPELHGMVDSLSREMGFDYFSLIQLDLSRDPGTRRLISISSYPQSWMEDLVSRRFYEDDPAYLASCRTSVGFRWADMADIIPLGRRQRTILNKSRRAGLSDGFTVPAHIPGESNGLSTFVVGPRRQLPEARLPMAQLVGAFAYEAARRIRRASRPAPDPVSLTQRQIECVLLVARGKSDWEIGRILGIAEDTVTEHLDGARQRYGVSRRGQLVVRALYEGHFSITDAMS